jgi:spermidine synthase
MLKNCPAQAGQFSLCVTLFTKFSNASNRKSMPSVMYGLTIFLSAFLLFQVQPIMGKMVLPWFGGSASVWTTCMLFFQSLLLIGYLYTHWLVNHLNIKRQSWLHGLLLLACLSMLPIGANEVWKPQGTENPTLQILGLLLISIGLPYFVLSSTGPLVQSWFSRERANAIPYRLFALSNLGSMLALLAYPLVIEPLLSLRWQSLTWSVLFACYAVASGYLVWYHRLAPAIDSLTADARKVQPAQAQAYLAAHGNNQTLQWNQKLLWVFLAACPSILMVANTSFLTENIAPIPLLWVAPLAVYLLSFVLCFESQGFYKRFVWIPLGAFSLGLLAYLPTLGVSEWPFAVVIPLDIGAFFVVCMVCHGELALKKPATQHLTAFYLMLSIGGFLGGFFVGVVGPYCFDSNYELSIGIVLAACVVIVSVMQSYMQLSVLTKRSFLLLGIVFVIGLAVLRIGDHRTKAEGVTWMGRNFYGSLKVFTHVTDGYRSMLHGQIIHGQQFIAPEKQQLATSYFTHDAGVGLALEAKAAQGPLHVGVIGVGAGTLLTYGRKEDTYHLYEIDPLVIQLAKQEFTFIRDTKAQTDIVLGDARLQLERESPQNFDVLVVDAFSGDSVPVHLLTREAFAVYFKHLKPKGVLAVHITNAFLDLKPVVQTAADHFSKQARVVDHIGDFSKLSFTSRWVLVTADGEFFDNPLLKSAKPLDVRTEFSPWRDDYSSLLSVYRPRK